MRHRRVASTLLLLLATAVVPLVAQAEKPAAPAEKSAAEDDKAARIAEAMALVQPGPEHARLARLAGAWRREYHFYFTPGGPTTLTGEGHNEAILGGRFLTMASTGGSGDSHFEAFQLVGFDRRSGLYSMYGCDSGGTYCIQSTGHWDEAQNAIVFHGADKDPRSGHEEVFDLIMRWVSDDEVATEIYFFKPDGSKFKALDITSRRAS